MKLLIFVTGRGTGGDAVTAYNISKSLEHKGIENKIVLDPSAPGYYFKKRNVEWLKSSIPAAGGHASSKSIHVIVTSDSRRSAPMALILSSSIDFPLFLLL